MNDHLVLRPAAACTLGALIALMATPGGATDPPAAPAGESVDCRYTTGFQPGSSEESPERTNQAFPGDDVFRPLFADPKQPQFFATYQAVRVRDAKTAVNVGSVGFGENFGFHTSRRGCDGWQVGILAGVFAQFDLDAASSDLINADYVIGIPLSWRSGAWSNRARLYHQSSHLGDEFLLGRPGFNRVNLSFEEVEDILSYDFRWLRVYGGGGVLVHREPDLDRVRAQWGLELRGPALHSPVLTKELRGLRMTPLVGADFKAFEELDWIVNSNVVAGLEWSREGAPRRFRFLVNYYHGFNPYGQFFAQKIETVGAGLYLAF